KGIIVNRYGTSENIFMEDDNILMMREMTDLPILAKIKEGDTDLGAQPF
ncbi:MAG: dethiobiotin synthase, partial [Fibrobacter sp.]|nr:dethiobiotin synthase [Fibrobacter sp.]